MLTHSKKYRLLSLAIMLIIVAFFSGLLIAAEAQPKVEATPIEAKQKPGEGGQPENQSSKPESSGPAIQAKATPSADTNKATEKTAPQKTDAQSQATESTFDLLELRVKGNTKLKDTIIERVVYPFLGLKKTIDTVVSAQKALQEEYHTKGYQTVTVDIPEQDVENGVVYLQVTEGKVSRLRVVDSHYFALGKIKDAVPEVAEGNVPNFNVMQDQLAALSGKSADRKITPILRAGDTPGTMEVDLKVKDKLPLHGKLELNGKNTSSTSRLRLIAALHYDNLWQLQHSASLMYQVSPENSQEVDVWAGTYAMPIPGSDARLAFYAVSSSSNAQVASFGALSVIGIGEVYGLRFVKPLPGLSGYSHSLTLGADYKNFQEDLNLIGADKPISTPIDYIPFMAQYSSTLNTEHAQTSFNLGVNFAVRGLGNEPKEFEEKRFDAKPNYVALQGGVNLLHDLPYGSEFYGRFSGQLADSPLISNEQFSLGGMATVRGYFETTALADDGFTGTLEVRSPSLAPLKYDYINKLQALLFIDGGFGTLKHPLASQPKSYSLASTGFGMRVQMWKYFSAVLDLGFPLLDLNTVSAGNPKLHFSVASEF